jgi:hypothetical protein
LTNTGTATLTVNNTFISGPDSADFTVTSGGGSFSLAAGAARTIDVRFAPRSAGGNADDAGTKSATLSIISNAPTSPNTIPLVGYGVLPNAAKLVASITLGSQRTGSTATPAVAITADAPPHYFRMMKELAMLGFFTTESGYTKAMRYQETPGRFDPCIAYKPGDPAWAPHA